jgi:hypothetical protein
LSLIQHVNGLTLGQLKNATPEEIWIEGPIDILYDQNNVIGFAPPVPKGVQWSVDALKNMKCFYNTRYIMSVINIGPENELHKMYYRFWEPTQINTESPEDNTASA